MSTLPGSSIKGAGALPPGNYRGYFEIKRTLASVSLWFVSMPHGIHYVEDDVNVVDIKVDVAYSVVVALSAGGVIARTDGGRFYIADAHTKEALTGQHSDVHECLIEAGGLKLKLAAPVIQQIREGENVVFQRDKSG
jgi:hypothetical protein